MIPLIPAAVIGLATISAYVVKKRMPPKMTAEQTLIYQGALNKSHDLGPEKLRMLSAAFAGEGFPQQANKLEMRARLREMTPEQKAERDEAYRMAMSSTDPEYCFRIADAFEETAADGAAKAIRDYAAGL